MSDVAYRLYQEGVLFGGQIPENLENYIDWDAIGRDLSFDGHWIETKTGYIEVAY